MMKGQRDHTVGRVRGVRLGLMETMVTGEFSGCNMKE